jgi:hypothetical protein
MVFSNNDQLTPGDGHTAQVVDSMRSTYRASKRRFLFAKSDLMQGVIRTEELSNGTFHLKDEFNYNPYDLWYDTIKVEAENFTYQGKTFLREDDDASGFTTSCKNHEGIDRVVSKENLYHTIESANRTKNLWYVEAERKSTNPQVHALTWTIPNVLSGEYYVGAVIVPKFIDMTEVKDSNAHTTALPNLLSLTLQANTAKDGANANKAAIKDVASSKELKNDPTRIDTVWICDKNDPTKRAKVKMPFCEYGLNKDKFSVNVEVRSLVKNKILAKDYDAVLRVDLIILEPVKLGEE